MNFKNYIVVGQILKELREQLIFNVKSKSKRRDASLKLIDKLRDNLEELMYIEHNKDENISTKIFYGELQNWHLLAGEKYNEDKF